MPATEEITSTQEELREKQLEKQFGRRIAPNMPFRTTAAIRPPHTVEEIDKFSRIYQKSQQAYVAIDAKTKNPLPEAKEFIYKIIAIITECLGSNEDEVRITFQVQKYWRNKTRLTAKDPMSDPSLRISGSEGIEINEPYCERKKNGDLKDTGERMIDADDFMAQFKAE